MLFELIELLPISFGAITFSYIIGKFLFNWEESSLSVNKSFSFFLNTLSGLTFIISAYSIVVCKGLTVNVFSFLGLIILLIRNKHPKFSFKGFDKKELISVLCLNFFVVILYGFYLVEREINIDLSYYGKISYYIAHRGVENYFHFFNDKKPEFVGLTAYHYYEFWLAGIINVVTGKLAMIALRYLSYPILITVVVYGIYSIISFFITGSRVILLVFIIVLCFLPTHKFINLPNTAWTMYADLRHNNFITYYLFTLPIFVCIILNNYRNFFPFSLLLISTSITIIPPFAAGLSLFLVFKWMNKSLNKQLAYEIVYVLLSILFMFLFYKTGGTHVNILVNVPLSEVLKKTLGIWKAVVSVMFFTILPVLFVCITGWLVRSKLITEGILKSNVTDLLVFVFAVAFSGVVLYQSVFSLINSYQLSYYGYAITGLLSVVLFTLILYKYSPLNWFPYTCILLILCSLFFSRSFFDFRNDPSLADRNFRLQGASYSFKNSMVDYLKKYPDSKGSFMVNKDEMYHIGPITREDMWFQEGQYIGYLTDKCNLYSITYKNALLSDSNGSYIFDKVKQWIKVFPDYCNDSVPINFLKNKEFDYVMVFNSNPICKDPAYNAIIDSLGRNALITRKENKH